MNGTASEAPLLDFAHFIARYLPGKIQKLTINAGSSCPNRDGTKGHGGCIYCNNASFSPDLGNGRTITEQLTRGKLFFSRKYPKMRYLAYFQSYTATHGDTNRFIGMCHEALAVDGVDGIIIGTRPDCMSDNLLDDLRKLNESHFIMLEYGAESANDSTLRRINRCHTWADTIDAVQRTADAGIPVGLHLIMGLPGETTDDMLHSIDEINKLPVDIIKCHQLQVIRGTKLAAQYASGTADIINFTIDEYIDLCCKIIHRLRPGIVIERFVSQSPSELLISPRWGLKNYQFMHLLHKRLAKYAL